MRQGAKRAAWWGLCGLTSLGLAACGPTKIATKTAPDIDKYVVKSVAVMPFEALPTPQVTDQRDTNVPPPPGAVRSEISLAIPPTVERVNQPTATVPSAAAEKIGKIVYNKLEKMTTVKVIPPWETGKVLTTLEQKTEGASKARVIRQLAERVPADAVLMGRVLIFQERDGGKWGGSPATVGFEITLVAADGKILWVGNYFEKQRPMIEDFAGFVERGGVFVTAEELAQYGAEHVVKYFPYRNPAQE